jgi:hypothetical protein
MTKPLIKKQTKTVKKTSAKKPVKQKILPLFLKPKPIKLVTRAVLENIADSIYSPKSKCYLNLCSGTLQNGPDPACETRPMHCGLGELYFVVTGHQPEQDGVSEEDVVELVTERSTIHELYKAQDKKLVVARKAIEKLGLSEDLTANLLDTLDNADNEAEYVVDEFSSLLNSIPGVNDQGGENKPDFESRAKRVAATLRDAAALLPR